MKFALLPAMQTRSGRELASKWVSYITADLFAAHPGMNLRIFLRYSHGELPDKLANQGKRDQVKARS